MQENRPSSNASADTVADANSAHVDQVEQLATSIANQHRFGLGGADKSSLRRYLKDREKVLRKAHQHFVSQPRLSTAGEWFLDNFHVIQEALRQIREDMPPHFYRELPTVETGSGERWPRIHMLACEIIRYSNNYLVFDQVRHFIQTYQAVASLTMGELWALPSMLRLGILENLTRTAAEIARLHVRGSSRSPADVPATGEAVTEDRSIANCILSLRGLGAYDWNDFFEGVSQVEQVLREDPADVYTKMDFETRDCYRKVVEELAKGMGRDEREVAKAAIQAARQGVANSARTSHVGFYLVDEGRTQLETRLGYRPTLREGIRRWVLNHPTSVYLGSIALLTAIVLGIFLGYARYAGGTLRQLLEVGLIGLLPATAVAIHAVNWIITHTIAPRRLPAMDYGEGIPTESRTIAVMPTMLTDANEVQALLRQLERHHLSNPDPNLLFALLTDFADAAQEHMPDDDDLIEQAVKGIRELNARYGGPSSGRFYLFHRERQWNPAEGYWMGWERKRGKLADFNRLLLGDRKEIHFTVQEGHQDGLEGIKYAITLDRDTIMPRDSAHQLVATMAHPLNRAQFDRHSGAVVAGYTVLQPRLEVWPPSANRSLFAQGFAGDTVVDLYTRAVSDAYQDLFGEGIYAGKGIYDIAAFERGLAGRVPQNALLSHDLFEGIHGRAGLCTTVTFYEDFPAHYLAYAFRQHRWIRGDWQLLPWLLPRVPSDSAKKIPNELSVIARWKIWDNLRRSLLPPSLLALLLAGWLWLPGSPLVWTLLALFISATPFFSQIVADLLLLIGGWSFFREAAMEPLLAKSRRWLLGLAFLTYETPIIVDAIGSTLVRLFITRRHLLQWTTAAHTIRLFRKERKLALAWVRMGSAAVLAVGLALLLAWLRPEVLPVAAPFLLTWLVSPQIAHWLSRPVVQEPVQLSAEQRQQLRSLARRTWLFFEQFVGPEDHWLPPDHYQEDPLGQHARRTSPTNIGMQLLSTLAAYALGYVGPADFAYRLRFTFNYLARLERYRGHFLNWYDTRNLHPLPPRYVSTVDSGNLAGCLLALKRGCQDVLEQPILRWQALEGLLDHLNLLSENLQFLQSPESKMGLESLQQFSDRMGERVLAVRDEPSQWRSMLAQLTESDWPEFELRLRQLLDSRAETLGVEAIRDLRIWSDLTNRHLRNTLMQIDDLLPWLHCLSNPPRLFTKEDVDAPIGNAWNALREALPVAAGLAAVPQTCQIGHEGLDELQALLLHQRLEGAEVQEAVTWCSDLTLKLDAAEEHALDLARILKGVVEESEGYFQAMDFQSLFDERREVFHIGYNVSSARMDKNYYDLLASEARLASLVAIAKGDVPRSHWLHLSRAFTRVSGTRTLLSWGGTMFEYLMPQLLMHSYRGTLLHQTNAAVVDRQIAYGREQGVPWGISESGYYRFDAAMNYQYQAFGVPGLGVKRGLGKDLVISPYASLLALSLRPNAVMDNLAALIERGMLGHYGLYEAIDCTASRVSPGQQSAIVRSYMAHHQGMIFLSIVNYLQDQIMVQRFHADPRIQATNLILYEQMPSQAPVEYPHPEETQAARPARPLPSDLPYRTSMRMPVPEVFLCSNGRYSVLITSAGGGYSRWNDLNLTRWRSDTTLDNWGSWIYVQDTKGAAIWSAAYQPVKAMPQWEEVLVYAHKVEFRRKDHDISLRMELTVSPDDDVEIRRVTLTNDSNRRRSLWLSSYAEVVLGPQAADVRHQAFNKLFVESEFVPQLNTLLFRRRPRSADEEPIYLAHLLVTRGLRKATGAYETDRACFLGRGQTPRAPAALRRGRNGLSGTVGATLDPIMCIGQSIRLLPHTTAQVAYITLAAASRDEALAMARRYGSWLTVRRAFGRARDIHRQKLRELDLSTPELERMQKLLSVLLYPHPALRADPGTLAGNRQGQSGLWPYAISGDYPILLVCIQSRENAALLYEVLRAHAYWRKRQLKVALVILNEQETGYADELHGYVHRLIARTGAETWLNRRGGIFVLRADQLSEESRVLLSAAARAILRCDKGSLADQVARLAEEPARLPDFVPTLFIEEAGKPTPALNRPEDLLFDNGLGGFSADGREYVVYLESGQWTPSPWVNIIANPDFGFLVSESGSGYTWAENSGENRLTPWRNDPVSDTPGEALYLRDEETAQVWSPTPLPAREAAPYLVRHGAGYSVFHHHSHGLKQQLRLFAVPDAPVKVIHLRLENLWNCHRRITATYYAEWVLGANRNKTQQYIVPECDTSRNVLLARNTYSAEFRERVAFLAASKELHGLTCDRTEFLGREGSMAEPAALKRLGLSGTVKAGLDPCAVAQIHVDLAPGESREVFFLLGQGADREEALQLVEQYQDLAQVEAAWGAVKSFWDGLLGKVKVETPEPAMNLILNRWLLYQALSCRVWARSALYQSGGAFGFRDQLQDVMALTHAAPEIAREHILRAARHQFEAGDVLHWWHPPSGRGVRTRYSDDLLWLPFVTAHYATRTCDASILKEKAPFRKAELLQPGELERYSHYETTSEAHDLYEHCCRALETGFTKGPHGLPLMGGGDWNDGMNRVGVDGQGESVWLGWFLCATLRGFAPLCELIGDDDRAAQYREMAQELVESLERGAWDGNWYLRAYFDDGTPLGSAENLECQIASIAQSWAVLSGAADPERAAQAMESVWQRLARQDERLLLLFAPPFDKTKQDPGYIKGYPPGIRENGGQYTHAALWAVWAFAMLGQGDRAEALFRFLNPIQHSATPEQVARYKVEPYVVAADVYSSPKHAGRGGWTWYTGSAGWMYRVGIEAILGLQRVGNSLRIEPCIPKDWSGYTIEYRHGKTLYRISVANPEGVNRGVCQVTLDGERLPTGKVPLLQDGKRHEVQVQMG